jgi:hypothetical protein
MQSAKHMRSAGKASAVFRAALHVFGAAICGVHAALQADSAALLSGVLYAVAAVWAGVGWYLCHLMTHDSTAEDD